jgi:hypothetical protein
MGVDKSEIYLQLSKGIPRFTVQIGYLQVRDGWLRFNLQERVGRGSAGGVGLLLVLRWCWCSRVPHGMRLHEWSFRVQLDEVGKKFA